MAVTSYETHENHLHIASVVKQIVPDHIRHQNPTLVLFAEKLLDFLEHNNKAAYYVNRIDMLRDIDRTDEILLTELQAELGAPIPRRFAADARILYKHVVELYKSRGTISSISSFFRLLFDDEVEIYFPKDDLFIPSDGKWSDQVDEIVANNVSYIPTYTFTISSATDTIGGKTVDTFTGNGLQQNFTLSFDPVYKENIAVWVDGVNETSNVTLNSNSISFNTAPANNSSIEAHILNVDDDGRPFKIDSFLLYLNGDVNVTHTATQETDPYFNAVVYTVQFKRANSSVPALASGDLIQIHRSGAFTTNDGFMDDRSKIQDSFFYQKFSYVLRTGANIDQWKDAFNRLIHPSGFIFFGEILLFIQKDDTLLPLFQPGRQISGLPFPIIINPANAKISFIKTKTIAGVPQMASYYEITFVDTEKPTTTYSVTPEEGRAHDNYTFAQTYINTRKFSLNTSLVGQYSQYTFNTNINKSIRYVMDAEVVQCDYNNYDPNGTSYCDDTFNLLAAQYGPTYIIP